MNKLATYLDQHGKSGREFATAIGVDPSIVSRLRSNDIKPSLKLAVAIERATDGAVPVDCWLSQPKRGAA